MQIQIQPEQLKLSFCWHKFLPIEKRPNLYIVKPEKLIITQSVRGLLQLNPSQGGPPQHKAPESLTKKQRSINKENIILNWDHMATAIVVAHHLDKEIHIMLKNLQWGSPSPGRQCSFHALQSNRLSSPRCRMKDHQTKP